MKKSKLLMSLLCIGLSVAVTCIFTIGERQVTDAKVTRIVNTQIDYQSLLETFDDYTLDITDEKITLEAEKIIPAELFDELDNLSVANPAENGTPTVRYSIEYDLENNFVYLSMILIDFDESIIETETFVGAAFYDSNGQLDAVFNIDGEATLMSEMADAGLIDDCGWFSRLIKKVVKVVAVAVAVVAVAVAVVATAGVASVAVVGVGAVAVGTTTAVTTVAASLAVAAVAVGVAVHADVIVDTLAAAVEALAKAEVLTLTLALQLQKGAYFPAKVVGEFVMISPIPVHKDVVVQGMKTGALDVYTPLEPDAYSAALLAGNGAIPMYHPPHRANAGYFHHFHVAGHATGSHAFYGSPVF